MNGCAVDFGYVGDLNAVGANVFANLIDPPADDIDLRIGMSRPEAVLGGERTIATRPCALIRRKVHHCVDAIEQTAPKLLGDFVAYDALFIGPEVIKEATHDDAAELDVTRFIPKNQSASLANRLKPGIFVAGLEQFSGKLLEQRINGKSGEKTHRLFVFLVVEAGDDVLEVVSPRRRLIAIERLGDPEACFVVTKFFGDEIGDVLLDFEGLVTEDRLTKALGTVRGRAVLHPCAQAPPLCSRLPNLGRKIRAAQIREVNARGVPCEFARLRTQPPYLGILQLGDHRIGIGHLGDFFEERRLHDVISREAGKARDQPGRGALGCAPARGIPCILGLYDDATRSPLIHPILFSANAYSWKISPVRHPAQALRHPAGTGMFESRLLRQFIVVAEELNFRRAAIRLHMSQPPLSVAIRNLETQIGTSLFDRSKHHVRLTQAGQIFYSDAVRLLQQAQQAVERARRTGQGLEGSLRLSFVPSAALDLLPLIFKKFQRGYPTVQLRLTADNTRRQLQALRNGETDLALVVGPVPDTRDLTLIDLKAQKFAVAVPAGHALARRERVQLRELAAESFIAFPSSEGAGFATALTQACQSAGFVPRIVQEASQMQAIVTLVAGGLGIALVPESMRRLRMEDVSFVDIADTRGRAGYRLTFARLAANDNPVVDAFLSIAARAVKQSVRSTQAG